MTAWKGKADVRTRELHRVSMWVVSLCCHCCLPGRCWQDIGTWTGAGCDPRAAMRCVEFLQLTLPAVPSPAPGQVSVSGATGTSPGAPSTVLRSEAVPFSTHRNWKALKGKAALREGKRSSRKPDSGHQAQLPVLAGQPDGLRKRSLCP